MKKLHCLLAGAAMIASGCADKEASLTAENTGQMDVQETTEAVSSGIDEMSGETLDQAAMTDMAAAETAGSTVTATMEPVGEAIDAAGQGVSDSVATVASTTAVTASAVAAKPSAAVSGPAAAAVTASDLEQGKKIYSASCFACHGAGVAGAPKLGDAANWAPRIAQGMEVMAAHAIHGFKGANGYMPAKGGASKLTDEEVTAAVAYMVSASR